MADDMTRKLLSIALVALSFTGCTNYRAADRLGGIVAVTARDDRVELEPMPWLRVGLPRTTRAFPLKPGESLSIGDGRHASSELRYKGRVQDRYHFRVATYHRDPNEHPYETVEYVSVPAYAANPRDANLVAGRLQTVLPRGWRIVHIEQNTYPFLRPEGKGAGVFVATADFKPGPKDLAGGKDWDMAVYVMPPDYEDGGRDPTGGQAQTWPPSLVAATAEAKLYIWGSSVQEELQNQIRDALLK
jgi:hypothetical protein